MQWISDNLSTIIVSGILLVIVGLIIAAMVENKRKGKSSCGCGCSGCGMNGVCHEKDTKKND